MEFKDWRKPQSTDSQPTEQEPPKVRRYRGKQFEDYISEQIREAEARGEFDNLRGSGKPLNLSSNMYEGDKALGYNLLKSNGYAPGEIELAKEIRTEYERIEAKLAKVRHQGKVLSTRRVPPFASEKRAFNTTVEKVAAEYEKVLRELNRKILTLNLTAPVAMHMTPFDLERLMRDFREACPLFD